MTNSAEKNAGHSPHGCQVWPEEYLAVNFELLSYPKILIHAHSTSITPR